MSHHDTINSNDEFSRIPPRMHLHSARKLAGWVLGISVILTPITLAAPMSHSPREAGVAPVSGQVNLHGLPVRDVMICFDTNGDHAANGRVSADGSFRLYSHGRGRGAAAGTYRVHLFSIPGGPSLPAKYQDVGTSGLVVDVGPDWNDFSFDLR